MADKAPDVGKLAETAPTEPETVVPSDQEQVKQNHTTSHEAGGADPAPAADAAPGKRPKDRAKRAVAIHTGYVGTGYKGSSINRTLGDDVTIEQVLEKALFAAGCISEANFGSFSKINWTRASRTDKGVHSLGTVMGLRMLVDDSCYVAGPEGDSEGLALADEINKHLPPQIRVFSVQRTNKKFSARHMCEERIYQYYLPASMLDLKCDGSEDDAKRLATFREALACYVGARPFHNFTRRQVYQAGGANVQFKPGRRGPGGKRGREESNKEPEDKEAGAAAPEVAQGEGVDGEDTAATATAAAAAAVAGPGEEQPYSGAPDAPKCAGDADMAEAGPEASGQDGGEGAAGVPSAKQEQSAGQEAAAAGGAANAEQPARQEGDLTSGDADADAPPAKRPRMEETAEAVNAEVAEVATKPAAVQQAEAGTEPAEEAAGAAEDGSTGGQGRGRGGRAGGRGGGRADGGRQRVRGRGRGQEGSGGEEDEEEADEEGGAGELDDDDDEEDGAAGAEDGADGGGRRGSGPGGRGGRYGADGRVVQLLWQTEMDPRDRVTQTYYRRIMHFKAEDPKPLVEGGTPCLLLEVRGQSFMLHHIRHMIGGAIAVTLGLMSKDVLQGSMEPPARVTLPRAPPHTLLLADCTFGRFPQQYGPGDNDLRNVTGERLRVRAGALARREAFRGEVLLPALQQLVELPEWEQWKASLQACYPFPQDGIDRFLAAYLPWRNKKDAKRKARQEWIRGGGDEDGEGEGGQEAEAGAEAGCEARAEGDGEGDAAGGGERKRGGGGGGRSGGGWRGGRRGGGGGRYGGRGGGGGGGGWGRGGGGGRGGWGGGGGREGRRGGRS